jgi:methanogenic corrinoid protein MtbC1
MVDTPMRAHPMEQASQNPAERPDALLAGTAGVSQGNSQGASQRTSQAGSLGQSIGADEGMASRLPILLPADARHPALLRQIERVALPRLALTLQGIPLQGMLDRARTGQARGAVSSARAEQADAAGMPREAPNRSPAEPILAGPQVGPAEVSAFAELVRTSSLDAALVTVAQLQASGMPLDRIYLDLLAPAARRLGVLWLQDECGFTEVTLGLGLLHRVLHTLRADQQVEFRGRDPRRSILLATAPGEQHSFGLTMVAEFFRRAGWEVTIEIGRSAAELLDLARGEWFGILALSVSTDEHLDGLGGLLRQLRRASANPDIGVMVGGPVFDADPGLAALVGADIGGGEAAQAVLQAEGLLALLQHQAVD